MALPQHHIGHQDMPPKGGFPEFNINRNLPVKIPHGGYIWGGAIAICAWGWYRLAKGRLVRRLREKEKLDCRVAITPYLQAEEDLDFVRRRDTLLQMEKELMKDVPGWVNGQSVYNQTERWMAPAKSI